MTSKMEIDYAILKEDKRRSKRMSAQMIQAALAFASVSLLLFGLLFVGSAFVQNGVAAYTFLLGVICVGSACCLALGIMQTAKAYKTETGEDL